LDKRVKLRKKREKKTISIKLITILREEGEGGGEKKKGRHNNRTEKKKKLR
jgi:hypothetical protein